MLGNEPGGSVTMVSTVSGKTHGFAIVGSLPGLIAAPPPVELSTPPQPRNSIPAGIQSSSEKSFVAARWLLLISSV
jgi:hypothetical protein